MHKHELLSRDFSCHLKLEKHRTFDKRRLEIVPQLILRCHNKKKYRKLNKISEYINFFQGFLYNYLKMNFSKSYTLIFQQIIRYMFVHMQHFIHLFIVFLYENL